ncbi:MAG: tyrosine-type recombinase/integrase [Myxococcota bacterium]
MTARREKRRDPDTGVTRMFWMIDVNFTHPDGRGQRVRKVSPVQTRRGAEAYERELRAALLAGTHRRKEAPVPTLQQFAKEFLDGYAKANNKPSEVAAKEWILRLHLVPALGRRRLGDIDARGIERYKADKLGEGYQPTTVNNHLMTLGKLLRVAKEWGVIEYVPTIRRLKVAKPAFDFLSFSEADRLVEAAEPEWRAMIVLALNTGLRLGELIGLQWDDCDLKARRLLVRRSSWHGVLGTPKSGRQREVPLNALALDALKRHRHLRGPWVFCREDGSPLKQHHGRPVLRRACKRAGLREVQWHCLRHSFASGMVIRGETLKAVQELLGHASIEMTMRYSHLSPVVRRSAVDAHVAREPIPDGNMTATEVGHAVRRKRRGRKSQ